MSASSITRVGTGYDLHRLVEGRPLFLGGIRIKHPRGLLGHSDADVLLHAVCDALLGAAALGDIGEHFPDTDPQYRGISSVRLLAKVTELLSGRGYATVNLDATLFAERPKLTPFKAAITQNLAALLNLPPSRISVTAKTMEGLGAVGSGDAIAAAATVSITGPAD